MIYFTSDFHFGHDREFIYGPRGYNNIHEEAEDLIQKFNSIVTWEDSVYILGDCMLNNDDFGLSCLRQLNGFKWLIVGNHDSMTRIEKYKNSGIFMSVDYGGRLQYNGWTYLLSHYPQITENYQERHKVISLCGHSHTKDPFLHWDKGLIYHVEVDAHNNYPVSIEEIEKDIRNQMNI